jgi:hypothetical protein
VPDVLGEFFWYAGDRSKVRKDDMRIMLAEHQANVRLTLLERQRGVQIAGGAADLGAILPVRGVEIEE